jgi:glycosyltransferase involved in cell wall biosynthesis
VFLLKNILIISFFFPPMMEIGGVRIIGLAKNLPLFGWNPIILTPVLPGEPDKAIRIIQTPYDNVIEKWKKRVGLNPKMTLNTQFNVEVREKNHLSILDRCAVLPNEMISYPDDKIGWYDYALIAGENILNNEEVDAIFSSAYPFTCHLIAKTLAEKYRIPWIADFRDLWTQNHYSVHTKIRTFFERQLELKTISEASVITTVSAPLADKLKELHSTKPVLTIQNGFDPEMLNHNTPVSLKFSIVYTGVLYQGKRDPNQLFKVINELCEEKFFKRSDIVIDFYGSSEQWLQEDICRYHLADIVNIHGWVSRENSLHIQREAQILLLLTWEDPAEKGVYTGKLFDYLAACRPVLSMGYSEGGVIKDLLDQTQVGVHISNERELKEYLSTAYHEYIETGVVKYHGIDAEVMKYSHREMAKKFAEVLDRVLK